MLPAGSCRRIGRRAGTGRKSSVHRTRARLLRTRCQRPRRCAANHRDERAPPHSITSSARARKACAMSRPRVFAVFRLITNSKRVDCTIGKSAGLAPLRMRPGRQAGDAWNPFLSRELSRLVASTVPYDREARSPRQESNCRGFLSPDLSPFVSVLGPFRRAFAPAETAGAGAPSFAPPVGDFAFGLARDGRAPAQYNLLQGDGVGTQTGAVPSQLMSRRAWRFGSPS